MTRRALYAGFAAAVLLISRQAAVGNDHLMSTGALIDGDSVYIQHDPNKRVSSFNEGIRAHGIQGHIASCFLLIDVPVGIAHGNHTYGGYCVLADDKERQELVAVCDDEMVSHFALIAPSPTADWSEAELASFVRANCIGG